ncbi:cell shape-determining protein MreC [Pseudohongiella nitratireducens]|uniref:Cell shape-determining protein MreC n=2 Tax=Pseudohongiella nitratireducens TaxID=1768907 RepID=A0A917GNW0_9GAMM|nr:cell shape-determining protein MreC [Pseudohongiella nitratireducens]|tara:strand:- start:11536 stop:12483 length:948 start_codon:yes stop_codon:yes gene_type:complete
MFADRQFDYMDRVRFTVAYLTTPVYWVADIPARTSSWMDDVFVSHRDLIEENAELRQQLLFAQRELQLLAGLASENNRLRELQAAAQGIQGEVETAEIINVSNDPGSRRVLINKGVHDGVREGYAVLDAHGLMGQVVEALPFTSWVMLITDSRHGTPVQVNRNGERAIARGQRGQVPGLVLEFVPDTADIQIGDLLVSSGLGQRFPKDYPVAEVTDVVHDPGQAFAIISARPMAQLDRTRLVMLVEPELPETPERLPDTQSDGEPQPVEEVSAGIGSEENPAVSDNEASPDVVEATAGEASDTAVETVNDAAGEQ